MYVSRDFCIYVHRCVELSRSLYVRRICIHMYHVCTTVRTYRIRQNILGGKLLWFSRILAKRECFTIETFPASQLENNYRSQ